MLSVSTTDGDESKPPNVALKTTPSGFVCFLGPHPTSTVESVARKRMSFEETERLQAKAVRFLRDVVGDDYKADDFEAMTPYEYAEHKGVEITEENPSGGPRTNQRRPTMTKTELEHRIAELEEENEDLQNRLDTVLDIVQPEEEQEDDDDEDADENDQECAA